MSVVQLRPLARVHARLREMLALAYGLDADDEALRDTLEGESNFTDECVNALRNANIREAYAAGCDVLIKRLQERKARWLAGRDAIRASVTEAMQEAGEMRITAADMTVSFRVGKPKLIIDESALAPSFKISETVYSVDRERVQAAVDRGEVPVGVQITNGQPSITVRMK